MLLLLIDDCQPRLAMSVLSFAPLHLDPRKVVVHYFLFILLSSFPHQFIYSWQTPYCELSCRCCCCSWLGCIAEIRLISSGITKWPFSTTQHNTAELSFSWDTHSTAHKEEVRETANPHHQHQAGRPLRGKSLKSLKANRTTSEWTGQPSPPEPITSKSERTTLRRQDYVVVDGKHG